MIYYNVYVMYSFSSNYIFSPFIVSETSRHAF